MKARSMTPAADMVSSLRKGDRVGIRTPHGSILIGRVVIPSGTHAAINLGGPHGTPGVVTPSNIAWKGSPLHVPLN